MYRYLKIVGDTDTFISDYYILYNSMKSVLSLQKCLPLFYNIQLVTFWDDSTEKERTVLL